MKWRTANKRTLWLATPQSRKLDTGGVVYRLDPVTLEVTSDDS